MNRRQLLIAAPALCNVVGGASAVAQDIETPSPIRVLFGQWKEYSAWLEGPETVDMSDHEFNAAVDIRNNLEEDILALPARAADDIFLKIAAYTDFGNGSLPEHTHLPKLWREIHSAIREGGSQ